MHPHEHEEETDRPYEPIEGMFTPLAQAIATDPKWIIRDLIVPGLMIIGGPPKDAQKTTLLTAIALLVSGHPECHVLPPFISIVERTGPVLMLSAENDAGELKDMCVNGFGVEPHDDDSILIADEPLQFRLDDEGAVEQLMFWLEDRKPRLFCVDPLRDYHELEEKDAASMARLLRPLQKWGKKNDSCVMLVHHTRKRDQSRDGSSEYGADDLRGSTAIFGKADGLLMISPKGEGKFHIDAKFKRAGGWKRLCRFAAYEYKSLPATEIMNKLDEQVFNCLKLGAGKLDDIVVQLHRGKAAIVESMQRLARNGLVKKDGKQWVRVIKKTHSVSPSGSR